MKEILSSSDFARNLTIKVLQTHIGFIPQERNDPDYQGLVKVLQRIVDYCKKNSQTFTLETGQEKAQRLVLYQSFPHRMSL